ncbi:MAG TPA: AMP-binding protein [Candidatus Acidoferrales bacterium]|nr:AMP-binding protein [Candidatus Acidoferrales bacterium]
MASTRQQIDLQLLRERVLRVAREILQELGNEHALRSLCCESHLERDLGLGSLERVELLVRLGAAFHLTLADAAIAQANTIEDIVGAIGKSLRAELASDPAAPPAARDVTGQLADAAQLTRGAEPSSLSEGVPWAETLLDVIYHRARTDAERPHLFLYEGDTPLDPVSFGDLYSNSLRVAQGLRERGIVAGDTVSLMLPTGLEFFFCFTGVLLAGAVPVPIYPPFRVDRIEEYAARQSAILHNAGAKLLITFDRAEKVARLLAPQVRSLSAVVNASDLVATRGETPAAKTLLSGPVTRKGSDLALLQYTSGSTGDPKGVMLTHANLLANIRAIGQAVGVRNDDVGTTWLPLYHDMGLIGAWLVPLYFGLPLAVMSPMDFLSRPERWLRMIHRHRGSLAAAPNFAYELCARKVADEELESLDLSCWRAALNGAEPVQHETVERFITRFARCGFRREAMLPVYGLAETALALAIPPIDRGPRVDTIAREEFRQHGRALPFSARNGDHADASAIRFVSVGRPLAAHDVRIVTADGLDAGERCEGDLWFRGPSATSGYYNNPSATEKLFPAGPPQGGSCAWINSGDRAYFAEGDLFITGRVKDIIIKAGHNIYPHEVELAASRVDGIRKGCVVAFGADGSNSGTERLILAAEVRDPSALRDATRRADLTGAVSAEVASAIGVPPDAMVLLPPGSIPKTSSGKLRRAETRRLYLENRIGTLPAASWIQISRLAAASMLHRAGRAFQALAHVVYGSYAVVVLAILILPAWVLVKFVGNRETVASVTSKTLRLCFALIGVRLRVEGLQNLDKRRPSVIVANHSSYADVLALMAGLGVHYRFVAKIEVMRMPVVGTFMRKLDHLAFDRSDPRSRRGIAAEIEARLRAGESIFVFPEGTFTAQAGVRPFQLGAFKAAVQTGCDVVPVAVSGMRKFLRDGMWLPRRAPVTIQVLPALQPAPDSSAGSAKSGWQEMVRLRDTARDEISRASGEPLL